MKLFTAHGDGASDWERFAPASNEPDYCSYEGALALKAKIEAYWRERGQPVMIALHNVGFHPAIRAARYDVRSDMVNGLPQRFCAANPGEAGPAQHPGNQDETTHD